MPETIKETREMTGVQDIPDCAKCGQPLTSNEFDNEPGGPPMDSPLRFFSSHSGCRFA